MRRFLALVVLTFLGAVSALSAEMPSLTDPVQVTRYEAFTHALRCLKCEHQSIAESDSDFSKDVKAWVAQAIVDGRSDQEIKDMLQARFGDRIFLDPPWQMNTYVLWFFPFLLCAIGGLGWICRIRTWQK